MKSPENFLE
jgi:oxysterol-binding protein 1